MTSAPNDNMIPAHAAHRAEMARAARIRGMRYPLDTKRAGDALTSAYVRAGVMDHGSVVQARSALAAIHHGYLPTTAWDLHSRCPGIVFG